ncbi:Cytochrome P450 90D2 [Apostasia shenzhenica]|uniref:Cytochrome P450 90D2 n=1 Tax=Apostasia shenzhenica TaxID=1088818 RepID=A0A2I0B766_9ASPA|nr:Cytochrome P450 90D2 [Apostasia shenzhenica]
MPLLQINCPHILLLSTSISLPSEMENPLLLLLLATLLAALVLFLRRFSRRSGRRSPLPGGSLGWPIIGETLDFVSAAYSTRPESFMDRRRRLYGKVFKSHLFGTPTIVSTDADVSRFVLHSDAKSFVPAYPKSLTELMGRSSILVISGGLHRRVHGLAASFFKSPLLKSQLTAGMQSSVRRAMASWSDGNLVLIQDQAKQIVFEILVKGLIGLEPGEEMQFLKREFQEFIAGLISLPIKLPGTRLHRSLQAKKKMMMLVKRIIEEKRRKKQKNEAGLSNPRDVIDVLVNDTGGELTDELISSNMIDFMIPAEDSVPVLITLAVKYLSDCPLALRRLEEENVELMERKSRSGEELQWNDYMALSFTQDVITETLRLGNIIGGIMRKTVRDLEVKGHFMPKGWCVFAYFRSVHLDNTLYDDPLSFNPWRWKDMEKMMSCSFTPFGGGQRLCPGLELARLEASIFLHHLVDGRGGPGGELPHGEVEGRDARTCHQEDEHVRAGRLRTCAPVGPLVRVFGQRHGPEATAAFLKYLHVWAFDRTWEVDSAELESVHWFRSPRASRA